MKKILVIALLLLLAVSVVACGPSAAMAAVLKSDVARDTSPQVSATDLQTLLNGNSDFAFSLYRVLKENNTGNMFYSPYSISLMMAMAYAGARGETEQQMADAMEFNLNQEELHAAFNYLALQLALRTSEEADFQLDIVNDVWGQKDYPFLDSYLDVLAENYGAGLRILDFINDPEGARQTINDYIYEQTNQLIEDLIPEGSINILTRLVLTNAIYFKADWKSKFDKNSTHDGIFNLVNGTQITIPMMTQREMYQIAFNDNWKAIELPYEGDSIAMDIIVPQDFTAFENSMDFDTLNLILGQMQSGDVSLTMPKFKFSSDFDLKDALTALGMPIAFDEYEADFSGIATLEQLYIQKVIHKAVVAVDEEGTEAAAAGAVIIGTLSMPQMFTVDSPFIFLIRDLATGTILFMGRVMNPAA
ncbi:MAG: serpin family protein [Dehalococcoidales bacterium]|nr:serpin family protein [Dehalococcoidales bacterium]